MYGICEYGDVMFREKDVRFLQKCGSPIVIVQGINRIPYHDILRNLGHFFVPHRLV